MYWNIYALFDKINHKIFEIRVLNIENCLTADFFEIYIRNSEITLGNRSIAVIQKASYQFYIVFALFIFQCSKGLSEAVCGNIP